MEDKRIINTNAVRRPVRYRGALISSDYNDSQEEVISDIQELSNVVNSLNARLTRTTLILNNENAHLRRKVNALREQQDFQEKTSVRFNTVTHRFVDFSNTDGIS